MKALVQDVYGTSDVLRIDDVARPEPGPGQVLVKVAAASVNAADWHIMRGEPRIARLMDRSIFGRRAPADPIRGRDFAGTIEAVGVGVAGWQVGDAVLGEDSGTVAEYVAVPETCLVPKPASVSFEDAAALPLAGVTADLMLTRGEVGTGQRVLLNGASGGVGTFATQLAVARGAHVTAVCSTRNVELVSSLGAKEVVDYTREDFTDRGDRYDVVIDLVGNRKVRDLRRCLVTGGILVLSGGGNPGEGRYVGPIGLIVSAMIYGRIVRQRVEIPLADVDTERLAVLVGMLERGEIGVVRDRTYPLDRAVDAMRHLENDHARGKIVVTV